MSEILWDEKEENSQPDKNNGRMEHFEFHFFTRFTQIATSRRSRVYGWVGGKRGFSREIYIITELNDPTLDILYHPLYQQTLRDVLSENEYAQYTQIQVERDNFRQQALRNLVVAEMDTLIFLDDDQRKQFEKITIPFTVPPLTEDPQRNMFDQLIEQLDNEILSQWQQNYLHSYLSDLDEI